MPPTENGWNEWSKYVLKELEGNADAHDKILVALGCLKTDMSSLKTDVAVLQVKAGLWGFAAGALPVSLAAFTKLLGLW